MKKTLDSLPLRLALCLPVGALAACHGSTAVETPDLGPRSTLTEAQIDQMRASCAFQPGTLPGLTLPSDALLGSQLPIDNVVVIIMENRSFDHLLSDLPAAGQPDVDVATASMTNPDSTGALIPFHHLTQMCFADPDHDWTPAHNEYDGGKNDGFVIANSYDGLDGARAMGFYTAADVPVLHGLATTYSIADHYHCSLLGPTWPNRDYFYAGSSFGHTDNTPFSNTAPTLMTRLDDAGVDWHEYYQSVPGTAVLGAADLAHIDSFGSFAIDAAAGQLAPVVLLDPDLAENMGAGGDDFHAPGDVQLGDQYLARTLAVLMAAPQWKHMAVFITFDENGGIFDHVVPPAACPPDAIPPDAGGGKFDQYGFRVPLVVVSPYSKPHYVSHHTYDHTSITHFIEARFLLPSLSGRDSNADPLYDLFDFTTATFATPPALPMPMVDPMQLASCEMAFPPIKH